MSYSYKFEVKKLHFLLMFLKCLLLIFEMSLKTVVLSEKKKYIYFASLSPLVSMCTNSASTLYIKYGLQRIFFLCDVVYNLLIFLHMNI